MLTGFTADVVALLTCRERLGDERLRDYLRDAGDDEAAADLLRRNLMTALAPDMTKATPFVQQVMFRALVDHVDWQAVVRRVRANPEWNWHGSCTLLQTQETRVMQTQPAEPSGTSFFGTTFQATVRDLYDLLGEPDVDTNDGIDKVNFDWFRKLESGEVFTVYDWKYYRRLKTGERVEWHIGGRSQEETERVRGELVAALTKKGVRK